MIPILHDSKRATNDSGRRPQKASDRGASHRRGIPFSRVYCKKEGLADFLLYPARYQYGDSEVREVKPLENESMECSTTPPTLTSLPTTEEGMAKLILPALRLHFIHESHANPAGNGGERWA
jgi:hypothetical protein